MTQAAPLADRGWPISRVLPALAAIALLALVVPYWLVSSLHQRRIDRADRELGALSTAVRGLRSTPATLFLSGRGVAPVFADEAWAVASPSPLARVAADPGPDPWGNSYFVVIHPAGPAMVISAGPDGILQTGFSSDVASGDDRMLAVR